MTPHASHSTPDTPAAPPALQVEEIAVQIEDPFGSKANDLPLEALALCRQLIRCFRPRTVLVKSRALSLLQQRLLTANRLAQHGLPTHWHGRPLVVAAVGVVAVRRVARRLQP